MAMGLAKIAEELRARRLAALERVADFLFAGQEAAWLRQLLREWRNMCTIWQWGRANSTKTGLRLQGRVAAQPL